MTTYEFRPKYYEWGLFKGDEEILTVGDFIPDLPETVDEQVACDMADLLMFPYREENREDIDFVAATEVIANEILRRFG